MEVQHAVRGQVLVCQPEGDLDEGALLRILALAGSADLVRTRGLVLDLAAASYISSQGVAGLLKLQTSLAGQKRSLSMTNPSPLVRRILYQAGVAQAIPIHASVEIACEETGKPSRS